MHPVLFEIGDFPIGTFGIMVALGFLVAIRYAVSNAKRIDVAAERIYDLSLIVILAALIGSRVAYIIVEWGWFLREPWALIFSREGYVFYGGFVLAGAATVYYTRRKRLPTWPLADAIAPAVALGHAFGRFGCFLNGCCFGEMCSFSTPLNRFPRIVDESGSIVGSQPYLEYLQQGRISPDDTYVLIHPTQLYAVVALLALFVVLHLLYRKANLVPGAVFVAYAAGYAVIRFIIEFFRGDPRGHIGRMSTSQAIALIVFAGAIALYFYLRSKEPSPETSKQKT